jgi:hypothetical protein
MQHSAFGARTAPQGMPVQARLDGDRDEQANPQVRRPQQDDVAPDAGMLNPILLHQAQA